jgi:hypothetical protein
MLALIRRQCALHFCISYPAEETMKATIALLSLLMLAALPQQAAAGLGDIDDAVTAFSQVDPTAATKGKSASRSQQIPSRSQSARSGAQPHGQAGIAAEAKGKAEAIIKSFGLSGGLPDMGGF